MERSIVSIVAYCDGGAKPNPGRIYGSFIVFEDGRVVDSICLDFSTYTKIGTNNQAEYCALIELLNYLNQRGYSDATIRMDSLLVINQVTNLWEVKQKKLRDLKLTVDQFLKLLGDIQFEHIAESRMKKILGH